MATFESFPATTSQNAYAYRTRFGDDEDMTLDPEDDELASKSKLSYPGETIAFAQMFMR